MARLEAEVASRRRGKLKGLSVLVALALALSLGIVTLPMASEVGAAPGTLIVVPFTLSTSGSATAVWTTADKHTGSYSVRLTTSAAGDYAGVGMTAYNGTVDSITSLSFWYEHITYAGWCGPRISLLLLKDGQNYLAMTGCAVNSASWKQADAINGVKDTDWYTTGTGNEIWWYGTWDGTDFATYSQVGGPITFSALQTALTGAAVQGVAIYMGVVDGVNVQAGGAYVDDPEVNGTTYYGMIQDAIDAADPGDTINVAAGIYQEDITISKELTLQGAGRTTTTIQRNASISQVVLIQADNVKIDGFKIDGGGSYPYQCDHMVSLSTAGSPPYENIEVSDCHLLHCNGAAIWFNGDPPGGLAVGTGYKINDNTIEYFAGDDCSVGTCQYRGIAVGKTLGLEIKRNTITNSNPWEYKGDHFTYGGYAIYLKDYTGGTIEDNVISKCLYGIVVNSNVAETWVNSNTITECHRGIVTGEVFAKIHITNNSITTRRDPGNPVHAKNVNEQGILIGGDGDWYDSSPTYAWQVDNLQHEVSGNTVTGTSTTDSFGLGVMPGWWDEDYGVSGTFTGNSISGYKYGMKVWGTYAPWDGSTEDKTGHVHVSFGFNNIVSCTTDAAVDGVWSRADGGIDAENNWWGAGTGPTSASAKYDCDPWLGTALEEVQSETISGSGTIQDTPTGGDITIDATGNHTITATKYAENPGGPCPFTSEGSYYDVHLDDATNVTSLTIQFCPAHENEVICYWDGSSWVQASNQVYSNGCIVVTITDETQPSLSDLTGLSFGQGFVVPVGGEACPVNKLAILAPWIAVAVVLAGGISWYVMRRRKAEG